MSAFKGFVDGTLVERTGAFLEPDTDAPETDGGPLVTSQHHLDALVLRANLAGFPVALHAIGDRAVRAVVIDGAVEKNEL